MAKIDCAAALSKALVEHGFSPFLGTPCGILAPLYSRLEKDAGLLTITREDNAVGVAAGSSLGGSIPVVLMQNSGLGQSVNAIASLVVPFVIPMLFVIGMRGVPPDPTQENQLMGRLTPSLLAESGILSSCLDPRNITGQASWAWHVVAERREPAALLVPPTLFGWRP